MGRQLLQALEHVRRLQRLLKRSTLDQWVGDLPCRRLTACEVRPCAFAQFTAASVLPVSEEHDRLGVFHRAAGSCPLRRMKWCRGWSSFVFAIEQPAAHHKSCFAFVVLQVPPNEQGFLCQDARVFRSVEDLISNNSACNTDLTTPKRFFCPLSPVPSPYRRVCARSDKNSKPHQIADWKRGGHLDWQTCCPRHCCRCRKLETWASSRSRLFRSQHHPLSVSFDREETAQRSLEATHRLKLLLQLQRLVHHPAQPDRSKSCLVHTQSLAKRKPWNC